MIHASRNRGAPRQKGWRHHYAAALYATGVPWHLVALALGDFVRPVSRQRVFMMLERAGLDWRQTEGITDAEVDAAIVAARAAGLTARGDIIAHAYRALDKRVGINRIRARLTALSGAAKTRRVPPPGTPDGWCWCATCEAFAPPSSTARRCRAHYNAYMREMGQKRRRAAGITGPGPRAETAARARAAVAAWRAGEQPSISAACRAHNVSRAVFCRIAEETP